MSIYKDKILFAKNPNEYINDSQRARATSFYSSICATYGETNLESLMKTKRRGKKYPDPLADLPIACHKDFGDYNKRRAELGTADFFSEIAKSLNFTAEHTENAEAP